MSNIIYKITNTINKKSYIGKTKYSIEKRWRRHCSKALNGSSFHFHNAIKKYGIHCWNFEILENNIDNNIINEREQFWIKFHDTFKEGYNSTSGGEGNTILSEETKMKISKNHARIGRPFPQKEETKMKISNTLNNRHRPEIVKEKISQSNKGKPKSEQHKLNISLSQIGKSRGPYKKKILNPQN